MNIEVLHDKIFIRKIEIEQKTEGGIILGSEPEGERETVFGQVVAIGEGKRIDGSGLIPTKCKEGDIISFMGRIPRRVMYKGEELYILRESDVDAIYRDSDIEIKRYEVDDKQYENASPLK